MFEKFLKDKSGNFAMTLALASLPMFGAIGLAVDYTQFHRIQSNMQNAADSAALAAVTDKEDLNQKEIAKLVRKFFAANGGDAEVSRRTRVRGRETTNDVVVRAWVRADTMFMHLLTDNKKRNLIRVVSRARKTQEKLKGVEVALVVDTTNSMNYGTSWNNIVNAVDTALETIEDETQAGRMYTTLVPFTDRINIGTSRTNWLSETDALGSWEGCVEPLERSVPGYPYQIEMKSPIGAFLPTVPKYWGGILVAENGARDCPEPITDPTTNLSNIRTAMSALRPMGDATGRFDDALAWGWRAVTKQWRGRWGNGGQYPSKDPEVQKIVAFFTDGLSNINVHELEAKKGEFGRNNGSKTLFEHFNNVCDRMKSEGIEVYIFHTIGNTHAEPYFRDCAGDNYVQVNSTTDLKEGLISMTERGTSSTPRLVR